MPLSVCPSSSSSSGSDSDSGLSDASPHNYQQRNAQQLIEYFLGAQTQDTHLRRTSSWYKLDNALVQGRFALLAESWSALAKALKHVEDGLQQASYGAKLGWRRPILYRLTQDIVRFVHEAIPKRRSLIASEAKSLSIIKQKLAKPRDTSRLWSIDLGDEQPIFGNNLSLPDQRFLDCFELALLTSTSNGSKSTLILSNLNLTELPNLLRNLAKLGRWYASFETSKGGMDVFDSLDLRDNEMSNFPLWLADAMPRLKRLHLTGNPLNLLPPVVTAFEDLAVLELDRSSRSPVPNTEALVQEAREKEIHQRSASGSYVPSLALLCTEVLKQNGYTPNMYDAPYLLPYWNIGQYTCTSCKRVIHAEDPSYLSAPLRERYTHFDPPVRILTAYGQLLSNISKSTYVVSSPEWTFCAPCLRLHTADTGTETVNKCMCIACSASRNMWSEKQAIRWTKLQVAV